mmetsp:Transcript_17959/g.52073  ORF Transcript_17959/g.52073 Transcript_17959/m.52073 type:complete len:109 (+) Transcript_17959:193-519(+)
MRPSSTSLRRVVRSHTVDEISNRRGGRRSGITGRSRLDGAGDSGGVDGYDGQSRGTAAETAHSWSIRSTATEGRREIMANATTTMSLCKFTHESREGSSLRSSYPVGG